MKRIKQKRSLYVLDWAERQLSSAQVKCKYTVLFPDNLIYDAKKSSFLNVKVPNPDREECFAVLTYFMKRITVPVDMSRHIREFTFSYSRIWAGEFVNTNLGYHVVFLISTVMSAPRTWTPNVAFKE